MSEEAPPSTTESGSRDQPPGGTMPLETGPPPRSAVALIAFLIALVLLPPWVAWVCRSGGLSGMRLGAGVGALGGLAAAALGIVGIFHTPRRRRRGRGLAIAAIPMGLVAALSQGVSGVALFTYTATHMAGSNALRILATPQDQLHENATAWYGQIASNRFREAVAQDQLESWLQSTIGRWGQLQRPEALPRLSRAATGGMSVRFRGRFVNGVTGIEVVVTVDDGKLKVDDIRVGDSSPRN